MQEKQLLRQQVLHQLKLQDPQEKQAKDQRLMKGLLMSSEYLEAETVATYLSMDWEVDTSPLLEAALTEGKRLVVPKVISKGEMVFLPYQKANLQKSPFGLWEPIDGTPVAPSTIDLMHVPGLVFNRKGYRIGYGGGFYDRYLTHYQGMTVSTAYAFQKKEFAEASHDQAVRKVIYE